MSSEQQNGDTMENEQKATIEETKEDDVKEAAPEEAKEDEDGGAGKDEKGEEEEDEEEESSDEEELPLGSVEAPVQIMTGKRDRKKVERLVVAETPKTPEKKFEVPVGRGVKLSDIELIQYRIDKFKAPDLKPLHKFLFGKTVRDMRETKRNVKNFSGFSFDKDDAEYNKRELLLCKFTVEGMKELCNLLDVEKKGTKDKVMDRLMEFCMNPQPSGRKPPEKGHGRGRPKTPKTKTKSKKSDGSEKKKKRKTKAGGDASAASEDGDTTMEDETEGEREGDTSIEQSDSDSKKAKKKSTPKPKKEKVKKDTPKSKTKSPKKQKKTTAEKSPSKKAKKTSPVKSPKKTPQKRKQEDLDDDSSDDEPLVKKAKGPPNDNEIKETIQDILDGANLEEVTMKMVCRKVYDTYPEFALQHKKDFIKSTVREIIS